MRKLHSEIGDIYGLKYTCHQAFLGAYFDRVKIILMKLKQNSYSQKNMENHFLQHKIETEHWFLLKN
jgi:hypothetical protein